MNGLDSNSGTHAAPFASLHQCKLAMEGSSTIKTCYIRAGSYAPPAADATICNGTTTCAVGLQSPTDNNETWSYYPPDGVNSADITGGSTASGNGLWDIFYAGNAANVTINGLSLHNFDFAAIGSEGGSTNLTVENNLIFNGFWPVATDGPQSGGGFMCYGCASLVVSNNVIHDIASFGITDDNVNGDISHERVTGNVLYNICTAIKDCGAIYSQDLNATATDIQWTNNYIRDGNTFATAGSGYGQALYLDDCMSNVTASGNIIAGKSGGNTLIIHGGNNNIFSDNLIDLATFGQKTMAIQTSSGTGCSAGTMSGNKFQNNILISGGGGGGYIVLSGSPVNTPTITNNAYHNYAGAAISSGGSYSDANPVSEDPQLTCWTYTINPGSPVFSSPVSFPGLPDTWGAPGFVLPHTGTAPSSPRTC